MSSHRFSMALVTAALLASTSALAQATAELGPSALMGTVSSAQEGNMEGVLVSAKQTGSTIMTTVVTDDQGRYAFPASRMQPGHYDVTIRAIGYQLPEPMAVDITATDAVSTNIALDEVTNPLELGMQMNNAEWRLSMPAPGLRCVRLPHAASHCLFRLHLGPIYANHRAHGQLCEQRPPDDSASSPSRAAYKLPSSIQ